MCTDSPEQERCMGIQIKEQCLVKNPVGVFSWMPLVWIVVIYLSLYDAGWETPLALLLNYACRQGKKGREGRTRGVIALFWSSLYDTGVSDSAHSTQIWRISVCNAFVVATSDGPHKSNTGVHTG